MNSPLPLSLRHLSKENDLNKILKIQKKTGQHLHILFTSLWDKPSQKLLRRLDSAWGCFSYDDVGMEDEDIPVYIVNSFTMPHSFVIFKTTRVPQLVTLRKTFVTSEDYLPLVYQKLMV